MFTNFWLKIVNGDKVFETKKIFLLWIRFSADTLDVLVNHLSPHSLHIHPHSATYIFKTLLSTSPFAIRSVYKYIDFSESFTVN